MRYIDIEKIKKELSSDNPAGWNDSDLAEKVNEYSNKIPMTRIEKLKNMTTRELAGLIDKLQSLELDGFCKSDCGNDDCLDPIPCIVKWLEEEADD